MAIKMKRSTAPAITVSNLYWGKIISVNTCELKNGERKIILELCPYDFETGQEYRNVEVWMADNEDRDARVGALLDSLPKCCETNMEKAVGESVGIKVCINDTTDRTFLNIIDFFEVSDADETSEESDDFENDDFNAEDEDEFISSETRQNQKNRRSSKK